jgi:hypothetical protein
MGIGRVISVHGVGRDQRWQEIIRVVMEPHFDYKPVSYGGFKYLFPFSLVQVLLDTRILFASVLASVILLRWFPGWSLLGLFGLSLAWVGAHFRRSSTVIGLFEKVSLLSRERPPHLVAHSFGTYLTGGVLEFPTVSLGRVVLAGCVLPTRFPWRRILASNRYAFEAVRNDVAKKDPIPRLAHWFGCGLLGPAGCEGFAFDAGLIHNLSSPYGPCERCRHGAAARIHNAYYDAHDHNRYFKTPDHAFAFWLPFLLGIEPTEFQDFIMFCRTAHELESLNRSDPRRRRLAPVTQEIRDHAWSFLGGKSLAEAVAAAMLEPSPSPESVAAALRNVWHIVAAAYPLRFDADQASSVRAALDPHNAIAQAVAAAP